MLLKNSESFIDAGDRFWKKVCFNINMITVTFIALLINKFPIKQNFTNM